MRSFALATRDCVGVALETCMDELSGKNCLVQRPEQLLCRKASYKDKSNCRDCTRRPSFRPFARVLILISFAPVGLTRGIRSSRWLRGSGRTRSGGRWDPSRPRRSVRAQSALIRAQVPGAARSRVSFNLSSSGEPLTSNSVTGGDSKSLCSPSDSIPSSQLGKALSP
jgi:hypothetical protein